MSTAAPTVPGRRENYTTASRRVIIPKRTTEYPGKPRQKDDIRRDAELNRIKGDIHRSWGKGEGFSYMFTETEERKPWQSTGGADTGKPVPPATNRLILRPLVEQKSVHGDRIEQIHAGAKQKKIAYERFMNKKDASAVKKPNPDSNTPGNSNINTSKGVITVTKDYDAIMEERLEMLEMHASFKKRIKKLEQENAEMVDNFRILTEENRKLRKQLNPNSDEPVIESYQRILEDRKILRKAEDGYKSRIRVLEYDLKEKENQCEKNVEELARLRKKETATSDVDRALPKLQQLENECKRWKTDNNKLKERLRGFEMKEAKEKRAQEMKLMQECSPRRWKKETVTPRVQYAIADEAEGHAVYETVPLGLYTSRSSDKANVVRGDKIKYSYSNSEMKDSRNMLPDIY